MIHPSPTTKIDAKLARGVLVELGPVVAGHHHNLVIEFPNTNYRLKLDASEMIAGEIGKRILGTIHASARRVDIVDSGGKYVEPVYGSPRRIQGRIIAIEGDSIVVDAGMPIYCEPGERGQTAEGFEVGQFVALGVLADTRFVQHKG